MSSKNSIIASWVKENPDLIRLIEERSGRPFDIDHLKDTNTVLSGLILLYLLQSKEIREVIDEMIKIIIDPEADLFEKDSALDTIAEALLPNIIDLEY